MRNQYFGDINDYRKYGLLRLLTNGGKIKTAVCWMLTPDQGHPKVWVNGPAERATAALAVGQRMSINDCMRRRRSFDDAG